MGDPAPRAVVGGDPAATGRSRRDLVLAIALGLALVTVVFAAVLPHLWYGLHASSDVHLDLDSATAVVNGQVPYRDFRFEYPPLVLPLLLAPGHTGDQATHLAAYQRWFSIEMYVVTLAASAVVTLTAWLLWPGRPSRTWQAAVSFAAFVAATGALIENRFDVAVALLAALTMLALARRRAALAGLLVGLGFALKVAPIVLLPLVLVVAGGRRAALRAGVAAAAGAVIPYLPFLILSPSGVARSFGYHAARPVQIESVPGMPLLVWHAIAGSRLWIAYTYGSHNIFGTGAGVAAAVAEPLTLVALGAVCALLWRGRMAVRVTPAALPTATLALLLAVTVFDKVLSPQYLIWMLPAGALLLISDRPLGALLLAATLATQIEFPALFAQLAHLHAPGIAAVVTRNVLLLATFAFATARLWRLGDTTVSERGERLAAGSPSGGTRVA